MSTTETTTTADYYAEQLARDTRDAKSAPEIAAWLRLGPLTLDEIIELRHDRLVASRYFEGRRAWARARLSVMYDLGRVAGLGGPVEYDGALFWLNEQHRAAIDAWVRDDAFRMLGRFLAKEGL